MINNYKYDKITCYYKDKILGETMLMYTFEFLGGLALFIYGMQLMGEGLQRAAGSKLQKILSAITGTVVIGVLVGALVTGIIQSSSATTVMTVGLVNAGLMTLKQAFSIVMGANIGTTMTAQLIAFNLTQYIKLIMAIGFAIYFISKKQQWRYFGQVVFGFGILMLGMEMMGDSVAPLKDYQGFVDFITNFSHRPLLGVLVGLVMTMIIQSSSATIGILMAMASQGIIPLEGAIPVLFGDNIGTCITAILASIGTNKTAKRTALAHVMFNVVGSLIFLLFMNYFINFVLYVSPPNDIARQIANAHTAFNLLNTLLFIPFTGLFVKAICIMLPGEEIIISQKPLYLDTNVLAAPAIAIGLASKEIIHMANLARDNVNAGMEAILEKNSKKIKFVKSHEPVVDSLEEAITVYLTKISEKKLSEDLSNRHTSLLHACNDIERIGDHAENLAKQAEMLIEEGGIVFSEAAKHELTAAAEAIDKCYKAAIQAMEFDDKEKAREALLLSKDVRALLRDIRKKHIQRLNDNQCTPVAGFVLIEMLTNLRRISDHSKNLAQLVLGIF